MGNAGELLATVCFQRIHIVDLRNPAKIFSESQKNPHGWFTVGTKAQWKRRWEWRNAAEYIDGRRCNRAKNPFARYLFTKGMPMQNSNSKLTEELVLEIIKKIPNAQAGFPASEQIRSRKARRDAAEIRRVECLMAENEERLQRLKQQALAKIRKEAR